MRNSCRNCCVILMVLTAAGGASAGQGAITGLTLSPTSADAGATVSATATGSGPCGAVHIDWGDGTAITYPTQTLPVTQTHVYKAGGKFTVRAQGMGNCSGQATASLTIAGPAPLPPAPRLTNVVLSAPSIEPRTAVTITLEGKGACRVTLDFGDGNSQEIGGTLPTSVRHTYSLPGRYTIVASPLPPCAERRDATLEVGVRPRQAITAVDVAHPPGASHGVRSITVRGSGRCSYLLEYGDGNSETRDATLPDTVRHNYPAEGRYTVVVTARPPCGGVQRSTVVVDRSLQGSISHLDVQPQVARVAQQISVTVAGSGTCRFVIDFDNGESRTLTGSLPYRLTYRYAQAGDYEIVVWTDAPCTGQADALLRIRRP